MQVFHGHMVSFCVEASISAGVHVNNVVTTYHVCNNIPLRNSAMHASLQLRGEEYQACVMCHILNLSFKCMLVST